MLSALGQSLNAFYSVVRPSYMTIVERAVHPDNAVAGIIYSLDGNTAHKAPVQLQNE